MTLNSGAAKEPPPELPHILANTSRAAVVPLNKSLSNEFGRDGITINTIATGYIGTPRMQAYYEKLARDRGVSADALVEQLTANVPVRRVGSPEEMAAVIVFLCSQQAGYVTGEFHRGGWRISSKCVVRPPRRQPDLRWLRDRLLRQRRDRYNIAGIAVVQDSGTHRGHFTRRTSQSSGSRKAVTCR